jgi:hypothetical protein
LGDGLGDATGDALIDLGLASTTLLNQFLTYGRHAIF